jgi:hypothetical protein
LSGDFRTIDGSGNNLTNPDWGMAGTDLLRGAPAQYSDGISSPSGIDGSRVRPSTRLISDVLDQERFSTGMNNRYMSDFVFVWGQFLDHDLDLTQDALNADGTGQEPLNIPVPQGDPAFDPMGTGTQVIPFNRSEWDPTTGTGVDNPRQQPNDVTSWIDGSMIYGADPTRAAALRTFQGGRLKISDGNLLPFNTDGLPNENFGPLPDDQLFLAGDIRANENIEITVMQTLFMREHNFWADQIHAAHPELDDETIYQLARQIVGAEIQSITYNEFLPALLGPNALPAYTGYNPAVDPGINNEFSTAAFRFGHNMLNDTILRLNNDGTSIPEGSLALKDDFFDPKLLDPSLPNHEGDIDPYLKGFASDNAQDVGLPMANAIRNTLFGPPGSGGLDLAAIDMQRGRDHGLANYNAVRVAYGLPAWSGFGQITKNIPLQNELRTLYQQDINNVDLWVGMLAEDHAPGASVSPIIKAILVDQFTRLRDGDRFWFENIFSGSQLQALENTTLADIIRRNTSLTNIQDNVFFFQVTISGTVFNDLNDSGQYEDGDPGLAGWTVQLENDQAQVIATTTTDAQGNYHFDNFSGLRLGTYYVQEIVPDGWVQTTADPGAIQLTSATSVTDVDFGNFQVSSVPGTGLSTLLTHADASPGILVPQTFGTGTFGISAVPSTGMESPQIGGQQQSSNFLAPRSEASQPGHLGQGALDNPLAGGLGATDAFFAQL